jgi:DNA-binding transcriptional LysR family regulator
MFDFRLQVFHKVAKRLNFTKAAEELFITQPAVSKHIKEIESFLKIKLFERNGSKIKLTPAGIILLSHTEKLFEIYRDLEFELNTVTQKFNGKLRIGASTTIAQYVLPQMLARFHEKFDQLTISLVANNTEQIEIALQNNEIDLGIIEGKSKKSYLKYTQFVKDEIVLVANSNNPLSKKQSITTDELKNIPLLVREQGSGTLEVIAHHLKPLSIKISDLNIEMQLGSTESIKNYILHSNCMAFLSVHSIFKELKENKYSIIDIKDFSIERNFYFIQQQGQAEALPELFMKFASHYNFK